MASECSICVCFSNPCLCRCRGDNFSRSGNVDNTQGEHEIDMKINMILIVGILFALLAVTVFAYVATQNPFPAFKYSTQTNQYLNVTTNIGPEDSRFMWTNNSLNLIAQAFVLFAAAAATLAMLRTNTKEESE